MRINTTINRYIFRELFGPFILTMVFLTFVFLMTKILEITNMIVNYRIGLADVAKLLIFSMPFFLEFVIPMSVMIAVLLTFLRLSGDNEIIALKSGGVSIWGVLPPVVVFSLMGCLMTGWAAIYGLPKGRLAFKELAVKLAASHADIALKERTFNDSFDGVTLYVSRIDLKNRLLRDVFIEDQRLEKVSRTVASPKGMIFMETGSYVFHLRLFDGVINQVDSASDTIHSIFFNTYEMRLDLTQTVQSGLSGPKDEEEMTLAELRAYIEADQKKDDQYFLTLMEYHKKFSLPFACVALGFLAMPLGVQARRASRSFGIGLGLVFFLLYYLLLSAGWVFGEAGIYPPHVGMWVPNLVMLVMGALIFRFTLKEKSIGIDRVIDWFWRLVSRFGKKRAQESHEPHESAEPLEIRQKEDRG